MKKITLDNYEKIYKGNMVFHNKYGFGKVIRNISTSLSDREMVDRLVDLCNMSLQQANSMIKNKNKDEPIMNSTKKSTIFEILFLFHDGRYMIDINSHELFLVDIDEISIYNKKFNQNKKGINEYDSYDAELI